jgi:hypothetical protein
MALFQIGKYAAWLYLGMSAMSFADVIGKVIQVSPI